MGRSVIKTPGDLLRAAGVPISVMRLNDFLRPLPEIEKLKPPGSRIVVAAGDGAVIFMAKREPWVLREVLDAVLSVFVPTLRAVVFLICGVGLALIAGRDLYDARTSDDWIRLSGTGFLILVFSCGYCILLFSTSTQLMDVFGRWQLIARPDQVVLRHSFMKFGVSTAIEPKYVVAGDLVRSGVKMTTPIRTGINNFSNFILGLTNDDAKWLEHGLKLLYPRIDEIES